MMNGLQSLEQWRGYYDNPHGSRLGVLNAIQVSSLRPTLADIDLT
jgi:hypothetical protein